MPLIDTTTPTATETAIAEIVRHTNSIANHYLFPDDIIRLHQFGCLDALPLPRRNILNLQRKLDQAFPEHVPSHLQVCFYRLALEIINNDPKALSTFTAHRAHYYWKNTGDLLESTIIWHYFLQGSTPCLYDRHQMDPGYTGATDIEMEFRPRLIDRMKIVEEADILGYLSEAEISLTQKMYDIFYRHCFLDESFADIAKSTDRKASGVRDAYRRILRRLRWSRYPSPIYELVFGPDTLGAISETT